MNDKERAYVEQRQSEEALMRAAEAAILDGLADEFGDAGDAGTPTVLQHPLPESKPLPFMAEAGATTDDLKLRIAALNSQTDVMEEKLVGISVTAKVWRVTHLAHAMAHLYDHNCESATVVLLKFAVNVIEALAKETMKLEGESGATSSD